MPEGAFITQLAFRLDESVRVPAIGLVPDVEIRLSTSSSLTPDLPGPFSLLVGTDVITAENRGMLSENATVSKAGLNPFTFNIRLDRPFFYDPRRGNLAVDILTYLGSTPPRPPTSFLLDADGDRAKMLAGGINDPRAIAVLPAPILSVSFFNIPEPSSVILFVAGGTCIVLLRPGK